MKWLEQLLERIKPKKVTNSFFGTLRWIKSDKPASGGYFEGKRIFRGKEIEITIDGKIEDTLEEQNKTFLFIELNYDDLFEKSFPLIQKELLSFQFEIESQTFINEFSLAGLSIEEKKAGTTEWDMGFKGVGGNYLFLTVYFKDSVPHIVAIDT